MAAAMARAGVCALGRSSLLTSCNFRIHDNLFLKTGVLWKHPPSRTFFSDRKKFHTASVGQVFRLRPFHVLVATGGGYAGYRKYEDYKLEQLEKKGIEVPVKLASEWEAKQAQYLIGHVLQPFGHAAGPSLDMLKSINTFLDSKKTGHSMV